MAEAPKKGKRGSPVAVSGKSFSDDMIPTAASLSLTHQPLLRSAVDEDMYRCMGLSWQFFFWPLYWLPTISALVLLVYLASSPSARRDKNIKLQFELRVVPELKDGRETGTSHRQHAFA